jgi:hypothetical protein
LPWPELGGEAEPLKLAEPSDHSRANLPILWLANLVAQVNYALVSRSLGGKRTVQLCPPVCRTLGFKAAPDLNIGLWSELLGN